MTEYAAGPSDPVWEESAGVLERGRYRIERADGPNQGWVLRVLRSEERQRENAPTGPHASMAGAKAWATHYDVESLRHLRLLRHGLLAVLVLVGAPVLYTMSIPATSTPAFLGVIFALVLLNLGLRELVWFGSLMFTAPSGEDLVRSTTVVDRAVARVVRSVMRPVDEPAESDAHVWIIDDWDGDRRG